MIRSSSFLAIALVMIFAWSCNRKNGQQGSIQPAQLGDTLSVVLNEPFTIASEDLTLSFFDVQDSRCPRYTNCIRAGEAIASIRLERPGVKQTIKLEAKGGCEDLKVSCGEEKLALGYHVLLLNVYPYPEDGAPKGKDAKQPEAKLIVMKRK